MARQGLDQPEAFQPGGSICASSTNQGSRGLKQPIVFVYDCLGGTAVEKALLSARLRQSDRTRIFMSVVGCIFLGTAFPCPKSQSKASLLAEMAETVGLGVGANSDFIKNI